MAQLIPSGFKQLAYQKIPARLLKYQIALRNYRRGEPEIRLLRQLVDRHRDAVDVGAYLGAYTFFLCRLARQVYVFEPQAACADFLARAYRGRVTLYRVALSDRHGSAVLKTHDDWPDQAATLAGPDVANGQIVALHRLDDYAFEDPGFIKIDAEGAEARILSGGEATLSNHRPVLLIEIEERHGADVTAVFAWLAERDYRGSFLYQGSEHPLREFSLQSMQRARLAGDRSKPYINNFIFRPA